MQEGVISKEAATQAKQAGLKVVMDRCMMKKHRKLQRIMPKKGGTPTLWLSHSLNIECEGERGEMAQGKHLSLLDEK